MKMLEVNLLDLIMSGEAARICAVDRRTFLSWAKRLGVLPAAVSQGKALFERKDVELIKKKMVDAKRNKE